MAVYRQDRHQPDELETVQGPCLIAANQVLPWLESQRAGWEEKTGEAIRFLLTGNALVAYPEDLQGHQNVSYGVSEWAGADVVVKLALKGWHNKAFIPAEQVSPLYVRDKVAFTTREREQGAGGNPKAGLPAAQKAQAGLPTEPDSEYIIRAMQEEDVDAVAQIEQEVQEHPWTKGNFLDSLKAGYPAWVLTDRQNTVLGFSVQMFAPDVSHLLLIGVTPGFQGQGLGSRLLGWAEHKMQEAGLNQQVLEVRPSNQQARAFYERHHYAQIGVRKGYYPGNNRQSEDALVLQKDIA